MDRAQDVDGNRDLDAQARAAHAAALTALSRPERDFDDAARAIWNAGRAEGYRAGHADGYREGQAEPGRSMALRLVLVSGTAAAGITAALLSFSV